MNRPKGFSLIELLVVIAIIGLLSTMAVVSLNNARQKARDSRRMGDIKALQTAMEMYKTGTDNDTVPVSTTWTLLQTALGTQLSSLPTDPQNNASNHYVYCHYNDTASVANRGKYVFAAVLETTTATPSDVDSVTVNTLTCVNSDATAVPTGINCKDGLGSIAGIADGTANVFCLGNL